MSDSGWRPRSGRARDEEWFKSNPLRGHRLRHAYDDEWPPGYMVAIRRGEEQKFVFRAAELVLLEEPPELGALAVWLLVAERIARRDQSPLSPDEIIARHALLQAQAQQGGRA